MHPKQKHLIVQEIDFKPFGYKKPNVGLDNITSGSNAMTPIYISMFLGSLVLTWKQNLTLLNNYVLIPGSVFRLRVACEQ